MAEYCSNNESWGSIMRRPVRSREDPGRIPVGDLCAALAVVAAFVMVLAVCLSALAPQPIFTVSEMSDLKR